MCERHREQSPPHRDAVECRIEQAAAVDADRTERDELVPSVRLEHPAQRPEDVVADARARMRQGRDVVRDPHGAR